MKTKWSWPVVLSLLIILLFAGPAQSVFAAPAAEFIFTASPSPSDANQEVTFTITATGTDLMYPLPFGYVEFYADGNSICQNVPLNTTGGSPADVPATCTTFSLAPGTHVITAAFASDKPSVYPDASLTLEGGHIVTEPNFSLAGIVFHDVNQDGVRDTSATSVEIPLAGGMLVSLDRGCDGTNDDSIYSDDNGYFAFNDLPGGATYCLAVTAWTGWEQSTPTNAFVLNSDQYFEVGFFAAPLRYSIWGKLFEDENQNGVMDEGESRLHDWTVYLDQGCDGQVDFTTTSNWGTYVFNNMLENQCYRITEEVQPGWTQTNVLADFWLTETTFEKNIGNYYPDIVITPAGFDLPPATVNTPYNQVFTASGGTEPYTFTTTEGTLPTTLTVSPAGVLAGTPTESGYHYFTLMVEDANHVIAFRTYNIQVQAMEEIGEYLLETSSNPSGVGEAVTFTFSGSDPNMGTIPPAGIVTFYDGDTVIAGCEQVWLNIDLVLQQFTDQPALCTTSSLAEGTHEIRAVYTDYTHFNDITLPLTQVVGAPAPALAGTVPAAAHAGSEMLMLNISGGVFAADAVVRWNGTDLATTFVSSEELTAVIPTTLLADPQTAQITVFSGGMTSNAVLFFVTESPAGVTGQEVSSGANPIVMLDQAAAAATGEGMLAVSLYDANPGGTASFTASGAYFDVYAAPGSTFTQVVIVACGLTETDQLYWWDGAAWQIAAPQFYVPDSGCIGLFVTDSSSPTLSQLQGTYFVAGTTNTAPTADPGGPYLAAISTAISLDGSLSSDPDGDPLTYEWSAAAGSLANASAMSPMYTAPDAPGIYAVCLTVSDGAATSDQVCTLAVAYDPSAGFVTGGGWISSPAGAYIPDPTLSGKATFGFVSKYKKGASVPTGDTEFQFAAGGFGFHSTTYDWLVVSKDQATAQFKGSGTVNGALDPNGNEYKFMLWAGDGTGPNGLDTFRVRIWWEEVNGEEHVVYDNGFTQEIGGGSIVVHTGK